MCIPFGRKRILYKFLLSQSQRFSFLWERRTGNGYYLARALKKPKIKTATWETYRSSKWYNSLPWIKIHFKQSSSELMVAINQHVLIYCKDDSSKPFRLMSKYLIQMKSFRSWTTLEKLTLGSHQKWSLPTLMEFSRRHFKNQLQHLQKQINKKHIL